MTVDPVVPIAQAVAISLKDLENGEVSLETLREAFGPDSLGILVVKDMPPNFSQLRSQTLSYASYLANLPEDELEKLENPTAEYLTGWSHGKEKLKEGQVDTMKGSYYANCAFYVDPKLTCARPTDKFTLESFPEYLAPNDWPSDETLPGFKNSLENTCRLMIDTAVLVARACDRFAEREIQDYTPGYIERVVRTSTTTKARLLHYFPRSQESTQSPAPNGSNGDDDWCATHLDHGCLTALTSAMFIDESEVKDALFTTQDKSQGTLPPLPELSSVPDPTSGLYIKSRTGKIVQVKIPRDCLAFQTGESLERITKGKFKAVPHFVQGITGDTSPKRIARNTLAVFTQPNLDEEIDTVQHITFGEFSRGVVSKNTVH